MNKQEAREVIHRYAFMCRFKHKISQQAWEDMPSDLSVVQPEEVLDAHFLVPEIWEHVGHMVWNPIRRDR